MALSGAPKGTDFGESVHSAKRGWGISLVGHQEAIRLFRQCKEAVNSERVQDEILPAAQLVRDVAKRLVNIGPDKKSKKSKGHLRDFIFATKGRRYNLGMIAATTTEVADIFSLTSGSEGPSVIMGVDLKKAPHAHLVEFGHAQVSGGKINIGRRARRRGDKEGTVLGYVAPRPFIRPAIAACRQMIVRIIEQALLKVLAPYNSN